MMTDMKGDAAGCVVLQTLLRLCGEERRAKRREYRWGGVKREGGRVRFRLAEMSGRLVEPRHRGPGPVLNRQNAAEM